MRNNNKGIIKIKEGKEKMKMYFYDRSETDILESLVDELLEHGIKSIEYFANCKVLHLGNGSKQVVLPKVFILQIDDDEGILELIRKISQ